MKTQKYLRDGVAGYTLDSSLLSFPQEEWLEVVSVVVSIVSVAWSVVSYTYVQKLCDHHNSFSVAGYVVVLCTVQNSTTKNAHPPLPSLIYVLSSQFIHKLCAKHLNEISKTFG